MWCDQQLSYFSYNNHRNKSVIIDNLTNPIVTMILDVFVYQ